MGKFKIGMMAGMIISCAGYVLIKEVIEIYHIRKNSRDLAKRVNKSRDEFLDYIKNYKS